MIRIDNITKGKTDKGKYKFFFEQPTRTYYVNPESIAYIREEVDMDGLKCWKTVLKDGHEIFSKSLPLKKKKPTA